MLSMHQEICDAKQKENDEKNQQKIEKLRKQEIALRIREMKKEKKSEESKAQPKKRERPPNEIQSKEQRTSDEDFVPWKRTRQPKIT